MTNYENVTCSMSPLDEALYELAQVRQQLEAQQSELAASLDALERIRREYSATRVNMAWQIMALKTEVK